MQIPMTQPTRNRRSIRLKGYDYTQPGAYFITLLTQGRECLFGEVVDGEMQLNAAGRIALEEWVRTPSVRPEMGIDEFVIMPNHVHGIVIICDIVGAHGRAPLRRAPLQNDPHQPTHRKPRSLGSFIAGYKSIVTRRVNAHLSTPGTPLWQRNYYDRILRDENEWDRARRYILSNPLNWELDSENPHLTEANL